MMTGKRDGGRMKNDLSLRLRVALQLPTPIFQWDALYYLCIMVGTCFSSINTVLVRSIFFLAKRLTATRFP